MTKLVVGGFKSIRERTEIPIAPLTFLSLFLEDSNGRRLDFTEVGSGVSYVLPVLVSLWGADLSWIEQPELHLHPAAQCELGDVAIRAFNRGRFSIIETHSEHMLLGVCGGFERPPQAKRSIPN